MADIKLEEAQAKMWVNDVKREVESVEGILRNVTASLTTIPTDDDTIFKGIRNAGVTLETAWERLCNAFNEVSGILDSVIKKTTTAGQELSDEINKLIREFNQN